MGKLKNHFLLDEEQALCTIQLGDLSDASAQVEAWCNRCGHYGVMAPEYLSKRLGPKIRVPEIGVYMECESCNSNDIAARPVWFDPEALMMAAE